MSDTPLGRNEIAIGGVLAVILLGGLFFLYRSLSVDPTGTPPSERAPLVTAEVEPARPAPKALNEPGTKPPPVNSPPRSGGAGLAGVGGSGTDEPSAGGSGSGGAMAVPGSGVPVRPRLNPPGQQNPWFVSGSIPGGRPLASGASGGGFLGGGNE